MIPALTVLADVMGFASGWFSMKLVLPITDADFSYGARIFWRHQDAYFSVIKAFFFAWSISSEVFARSSVMVFSVAPSRNTAATCPVSQISH
jgi:hypothetical protein